MPIQAVVEGIKWNNLYHPIDRRNNLKNMLKEDICGLDNFKKIRIVRKTLRGPYKADIDIPMNKGPH